MKVCCAVVSDNRSEIKRIPDGSSIFTVETKAIDIALHFIADYEITYKFIIFSDSLLVLKALDQYFFKTNLIKKLLEKHYQLSKYNRIVYCMIPSHIYITGNVNVDQNDKDSLYLLPTTFPIHS